MIARERSASAPGWALQMQRPLQLERPSHVSGAALLVADSDATYDPFAPLIDIYSPANVAVGPIVIDGRRDRDVETGEEPVVVMMMVVVLDEVE